MADEVMGSVAAAGVGWGWPAEAYEAWIYQSSESILFYL